MKMFKKIMCGVLATVMLATTVGCSKTKNEDEKVTLKWMIMTAEQEDSQMVWDKFNEELQNYMPGVEVEFIPCANSEYKQRFDLALAGGQQIDLAFFGWVMNLVNESAASSLLPLNDLLKEHGQKLYDSMDKWMWDLTSVDGEIYAVRNNSPMA